MLSFLDVKLARKLLTVAVLSAGIFVLSASQRVRAEDPCCEACNATAAACVDYCWNTDQIKDWMRAGCAADCETDRIACRHACSPVGAPEVCGVS
jgi:hypothetical protein